MRRAQIRTEVALQLAAKGYAPSWCYWEGATINILQRLPMNCVKLKLLSGISRKRLLAALAALPIVGPVRQIACGGAGAKDEYQYELERDYVNGRLG